MQLVICITAFKMWCFHLFFHFILLFLIGCGKKMKMLCFHVVTFIYRTIKSKFFLKNYKIQFPD